MACRTNRCGCGSCGCSPCKCNNSCNNGCGSSSTSSCGGSCGAKVVVNSKLVDGGKYRAVKYENGCCDKIARTWIPQTYNTIKGNGPRPLACCSGGNLRNTESECMDSMNKLFNHVNPASP